MGKEAKNPIETARLILEGDAKQMQHNDHTSKRSSTSEKAELNPDTTGGDGSESMSGDAKQRLEKNVSSKRSSSSEASKLKGNDTMSIDDPYDGQKAIDHTFNTIRQSTNALGEESELDEDLISEDDDMGDETDDMDDDEYEDDDEDVVESFKEMMEQLSNESSYKKAMQEHISALFKGIPSEISEEYQDKAVTIFESAVRERSNLVLEQLSEHFAEKLQEKVDQIQESYNQKYQGLIEEVDGYLDYVISEWMEENKIAVENGLVREMYEGFISGMKQVFLENYVEIPEEKYDILSSLEEENQSLREETNRLLEENASLTKENKTAERNSVIDSLCEDLTLSQRNKLESLLANVEYGPTFESKAKTLKESYFSETISDDSTEASEDYSNLLTEESTPSNNRFRDDSVDSIVDIISKRGFGKNR